MTKEQNKNQLPKDWKWMKLGNSVQVLDNLRKPINSSERQHRIEGKSKKELFPYYGATGQVGWIDSFITDGEYILVGEDGAPFLDNFKEKAYKINGKTWVNNHAHILREIDGVSINNFILHYLNSINYRHYVNGTTRLKLTKSSLVEIPFPLPPKPTQQAIVSKIEELFSELDKGIENLRTAQQQLKTYRQSVLKCGFEGKITNANIKDGELPQGWKMKRIDEVATVGTGATPLKSKSEYYGGNIAWVTSGALNEEYVREATDFVTEKAIKETNLSLYPKHTLLVAMYGEGKTRGKCSELLIEACTNQAIAAIYFNEKEIQIKPYLKYFLLKNYIDVRKKSSGGVQPNLNLGIIKKLQFPFAPVDEQNKIVQEIESRLSVADKMELSITQSLQQAESLRQSILKKAFEGRLIQNNLKELKSK